jgi:hypothetical protein
MCTKYGTEGNNAGNKQGNKQVDVARRNTSGNTSVLSLNPIVDK